MQCSRIPLFDHLVSAGEHSARIDFGKRLKRRAKARLFLSAFSSFHVDTFGPKDNRSVV